MSRKDEPELVSTGPYRTVRHPIYSGIFLGLLGTALAINLQLLLPVAAAGAYFVYCALMEERYLTERFPDRYAEYKRRTKMLIPFIL